MYSTGHIQLYTTCTRHVNMTCTYTTCCCTQYFRWVIYLRNSKFSTSCTTLYSKPSCGLDLARISFRTYILDHSLASLLIFHLCVTLFLCPKLVYSWNYNWKTLFSFEEGGGSHTFYKYTYKNLQLNKGRGVGWWLLGSAMPKIYKNMWKLFELSLSQCPSNYF